MKRDNSICMKKALKSVLPMLIGMIGLIIIMESESHTWSAMELEQMQNLGDKIDDFSSNSNKNPIFNWTTPTNETGIAGYSYILDCSSSTIPDKIIDRQKNTKSYSSMADRIWHFHVRAKDNASNWLIKNKVVFVENKTDIIKAIVTPNATIQGNIINIKAIVNGPLNSTDKIIAYIQKGENTVKTLFLQNVSYRTYQATLNTSGMKGMYVIDFYSKDVIEDEIYKNNFACFAVSRGTAPKGAFTGYYAEMTGNNLTLINAKSNVNITLSTMVNNRVENASINIAEYSVNPKRGIDGGVSIGTFTEIEADDNLSENLSYVIIKLYYDESSLQSWLDEKNLRIYYWNESKNSWEVVPNSGVNTVENYVWVNVTHFSIYGLFVKSVELQCTNNISYAKPNQVVTYNITVKNTGSIRDEISLSLDNVPNDWLAYLNKYSVWLDGGEEENVTLTIYVLTQNEGEFKISVYGESSENFGNVWDMINTTTVVDITPPIADAGNNQTIDEDTIAYFSGINSSDNIGIKKYSWDFNATDGIQEEAMGMNVHHNFTDPGNYTVTLTVEDYLGYRDTDTCIVTVLDSQPPEIPTNLTVTTVPIGNQLYLSWDANIDKDLAGYNVYRSTISGSGYIKINTLPVKGTSYQDTDLVNGKTYYYVITAFDKKPNESNFSKEANGTPAKIPFIFGNSTYINQNNANQYYPKIAVYNNEIYVVWIDYRNGNADIYFAKSTNRSFTGIAKVNDDSGSANQYYPKIVVNNYGIFVVWEDYRNGNADIYLGYSDDDGTTFTNYRVDHDTTNALQKNPSIAVKDGTIYVVWEDKRNSVWDIYFSYSTDNGKTFSNEIKVNNKTTNVDDYLRLSPSIVVSDEIYVTWHDKRNGNYDIFFSKSKKGKYFENDIKVNDNSDTSNQQYPVITYDSKIYIAWQDKRNGNWDIYIGESSDGNNWNNLCLDKNLDDQLYPSIAHGSDIYITWQDKRNGNWDIYASSLNNITSIEVVKRNKGQYYPSIAVGKDVYVVWQDENTFKNICFASSLEITYNTLPSIYSIKALPNKVLNGTNITISAVATSPSGISKVFAYIEKGDENNVISVQLHEVGDGTYANILNTDSFEGMYLIDIFAKDYSDNSIELENRACFAVTTDNSCEGIYQTLFNGNNETIDARKKTDVILEIHTKSRLTNSSICIAKYSRLQKGFNGTISLNKFIEIEVENNLSAVLNYFIIKIYYEEGELGKLDENKMKIYYWNSTSNKWEELKTYINKTEKYIYANLTHFSIYGVFEKILEGETKKFVKGNPKDIVAHGFTIKNLGNGDTFNFVASSKKGWNVNIIGGNSVYFNENETKIISVEVTIPDDAYAYEEDILTFNITTANTSAFLSLTTKTIANQLFSVFISFASQNQTLLPGQFYIYQFIVKNNGNGEDNFTLNVSSEHNWYTNIIGNDYVVLASQKSKKISVKLKVPYGEKILAGTTDILRFIAASKDNVTFSSNTSKTIVGQVYGIVLRCDKNETDYFTFPNDFFKYTIRVINNGNGKDTFNLTIIQGKADWKAKLSDKSVKLNGFESINITLEITPPINEEIGTKGVFSVRATSIGDSTKFDQISTLSTVPYPDLWVKEIFFNVGDAVLDGEKIKIFATIANSGTIARNFWVRISINSSGTWENLIDIQILSLEPGNTTNIAVSWIAKGGGFAQARVYVDCNDKIIESNENNNVLITNVPEIVAKQRVSSSFKSSFVTIFISVFVASIFCAFCKKMGKKHL